MRQDEAFELLTYLLTSAAGLQGEPKIYGPLRLVEAAKRLAQMMLERDRENQSLSELIELIDQNKGKTMSDEEGFYQMVQDAVVKLVEFT